ncbi:exosporium leader peptide-containing protein [Bacillus thuringiensis]|nr:exosporium leader peptide-containing protein [Bacillus thuringiensis]
MSNKNKKNSKWLHSYKSLVSSSINYNLVGPIFPPILSFTLPTY